MRVSLPLRIAATVCGLGLAAGCTNASSTSGSSAPTGSADPTAISSVDEAAVALLPAGVKDKGVLTVAMDASYPPFQSFDTDNTTIIGFDVDLSNALAAKLGLDAKQVNAGFDTILPGLAAQKYDMGESAFSVTPERAKTVDFVNYLSNGSGIAVKAGNPLGLEMDPTQLCGRPIAAQKGSTQGIEQLPQISDECVSAGQAPVDILLFPSQNDANLAVTSGRADAVMADSIALSTLAEQSDGQFELAPGKDYDSALMGIALPKDSELTAALQAAVDAVYADGQFAEIVAKWGLPETSMLDSEG